MVKKTGFSAKIAKVNLKGLCVCAAMAMAFTIPKQAAAMSDVKPAAIPAEIVADWKAQGIDETKGHTQRVERLKQFESRIGKLVYAKHYNLGGAIIGYTEDLNPGPGNKGSKFAGTVAMSKGSEYASGAGIYMLDFKDAYPKPIALIEDSKGMIKNPCVSLDGKKMVFAWSKSNNGYSIYQMDISDPSKPGTPEVLTTSPVAGQAVSDFEPCYTPAGDIIFMSSRYLNHVDCNFNLSSNLYMMAGDGKYLRHIGYDQVNVFHPSLREDGSIMYTRWEYNDRNVSTVFGIFSMNADGSKQTEYAGNQISNPATLSYASECPGTNGKKALSIIGGHSNSSTSGDLVQVDITKGRNSAAAFQKIAPKRALGSGGGMSGINDADRKFQTPYALSDTWFLISYRESSSDKLYRVYLMNLDGNRELLAWDANKSVSEAFPASPIDKDKRPKVTARKADYSKETGTCAMTNAYYGLGTGTKVKPGVIAKIRCIALVYRVFPWIGNTGTMAYTSTPVARWMGSWESKRVLGEMKVESDGSAAFILPARTPVYFQLIDTGGVCVQTMRSWTTLMPGEQFDCYGCHEDKNEALPANPNAIAMTPKPLEPAVNGKKDFYFYWPTEIQDAILDKKCVSCHKTGGTAPDLTKQNATLTGDNEMAGKTWLQSYMTLSESKYVNFVDVNSPAEGLQPYQKGSSKSSLISTLKKPPSGMTADITKAEIGTFAMWIDLCIPHSGEYTDDMTAENKTYYEGRKKLRADIEAIEKKNIADYVAAKQPYAGYTIDAIMPVADRRVFLKAHSALFSAQFMSSGSKIVLQLPGEGTVAIMDVLGRQIMSKSFGREMLRNSSNISIGAKLSKGIYIIKFKGSAVTEHQVLNVL